MASKDNVPETEKTDTGDSGQSDEHEGTGAEPELEQSPRRPAHTIDLKAEEVEEDGAGDGGKQPPRKDGKASPGKAAAGKTGGPASAKRRKEPPQRTSPRQVRAFVTHLAAGLVGGVIGVVGVGIGLEKLPLSTFLRGGQPQQTADDGALGGRIAALEQRIAALAETPPTNAKALETQKAFEDRIGRIEQNQAAQDGFPAAIKERVARIEETVKTLGETAAEGGDVGQTAAITARVQELTARLDARIAALEKAAGEPAGAVSSDEIAALKARVETLAAALEKQARAAPDGGVPQALAGRIAAVEDAIRRLGPNRTAGDGGAPGAALALRLSALTRAAEQGKPFGDELDALKKAAPAELDLSGLGVHARNGVPSRAALERAFRHSSGDALTAAAAPPGGESLIGRFLTSAQSVIRVRRIGDGSQDGAEAVLARMAERLQAGELSAAIEESAELPDAALTALAPWLDQARARLALDAAGSDVREQLARLLARDAPARTQ